MRNTCSAVVVLLVSVCMCACVKGCVLGGGDDSVFVPL